MLKSARRAQIELRMHIFETHFMDGQVEEGASFATKEQSGIWLQYFDFYPAVLMLSSHACGST
jgi:hypothetical protein